VAELLQKIGVGLLALGLSTFQTSADTQPLTAPHDLQCRDSLQRISSKENRPQSLVAESPTRLSFNPHAKFKFRVERIIKPIEKAEADLKPIFEASHNILYTDKDESGNLFGAQAIDVGKHFQNIHFDERTKSFKLIDW